MAALLEGAGITAGAAGTLTVVVGWLCGRLEWQAAGGRLCAIVVLAALAIYGVGRTIAAWHDRR